MTDAVGVVEVDSEREVVVRRRDGTLSTVARADILVIKAVPPPPARRSAASAPDLHEDG
jgi:hypothetical protein